MTNLKENENENIPQLLIKNLPKKIEDIIEILQTIEPQAKAIKAFGRRRALLEYGKYEEAEKALGELEQLDFGGRLLNVMFFNKEKPMDYERKPPRKVDKSTQVKVKSDKDTLDMAEIKKYVCKLYATNGNLNFDQPPPPYLRYEYPKVTPQIVENIAQVLLTNSRFYTQVLHLMNRMNLDPPFHRRTEPFACERTFQDQAAQTDIESRVGAKHWDPSEESESELETSGEEGLRKESQKVGRLKRKLPDIEENLKKKAKTILQASINTQKRRHPFKEKKSVPVQLKEVFEETPLKANKLEICLKPSIPSSASPAKVCEEKPKEEVVTKLTPFQMIEIPVFKNYKPGEPSDKLYIKNLSKEVQNEDLENLYRKYVERPEQLQVKVMHHGRMKGQAFVAFVDMEEEQLTQQIALALADTHGLVFKKKPMVVSYGRKQ